MRKCRASVNVYMNVSVSKTMSVSVPKHCCEGGQECVPKCEAQESPGRPDLLHSCLHLFYASRPSSLPPGSLSVPLCRVAQLEEEVSSCRSQLQQSQSELAGKEADNVSLYEKIRYLQRYSSNRQASSSNNLMTVVQVDDAGVAQSKVRPLCIGHSFQIEFRVLPADRSDSSSTSLFFCVHCNNHSFLTDVSVLAATPLTAIGLNFFINAIGLNLLSNAMISV